MLYDGYCTVMKKDGANPANTDNYKILDGLIADDYIDDNGVLWYPKSTEESRDQAIAFINRLVESCR